ncbi:MAG: DNA-formamidopyrimidine glycosylase family protein [Mycobacteriales bacterium]
MPEGDTVYLSARLLHEALAGTALTRAELRVPRHATAELAGMTVVEVIARGKHMLTRFDSELTLHTHFKMEGTWRRYAPGEKWSGGPDWQIRAILGNVDVVAVGYRLAVVDLIRTKDEHTVVGHLGPDTLGPDWDEEEAVRRIAAAPARPVAEALLDQRNLAGIGNLYKCEVLFLRGLSPWTPVAEVDDLPALVRLARKLLLANKDRWDQVTTGDTRRGRSTYVYGRQREACRRCGTPIRHDKGAGAEVTDRETWWCPNCQPGQR